MKFEFIKKLFNVTPNTGFCNNEINNAVDKWGAIPKVLVEYYSQLGKHNDINRSQNFLIAPDELYEVKDYLIFYIENQGAAEWGIKQSDLSKENPPVYCTKNRVDFSTESDTLTEFLNAMSLFQAASRGLKYACEDLYMISEQQADKIRKNFSGLPYKCNEWLNMEFYANNDDEVIMLIENDDYDMAFASSNQEHYNNIAKFTDTLNPETY